MTSTFFLGAALVILAAVTLSMYRVIRGPSIIDRIVGVNVIGTKTIAVIVLTGHLFGRVEFFVDIALLYALINFVGAVALSRYFERKGVDVTSERAR
jgi:multicomponent Na+:H+ antiporter subunit F